MPRKTKGKNINWELQPGWSYTRNDDGSASGTARFIADEGQPLIPEGVAHPKEPLIRAVTSIMTSLGNGKVACDVTYFGIWDTRRRITYSSGSSQEDIRSHKDFEKFAGDYDNPRNGAVWRKLKRADENTSGDTDVEEFLGFYKSAGASEQWAGVTDTLDVGGTVEVTYLVDRAPNLDRLMTISGIRGFSMPRGVKNALLVDMPYQEIGRNHYRVSEVYLLSGEKGWNPDIYG